MSKLYDPNGSALGDAAVNSGIADALASTAKLRAQQFLRGLLSVIDSQPMDEKTASQFLLRGHLEYRVATTAGQFVISIRRT